MSKYRIIFINSHFVKKLRLDSFSSQNAFGTVLIYLHTTYLHTGAAARTRALQIFTCFALFPSLSLSLSRSLSHTYLPSLSLCLYTFASLLRTGSSCSIEGFFWWHAFRCWIQVNRGSKVYLTMSTWPPGGSFNETTKTYCGWDLIMFTLSTWFLVKIWISWKPGNLEDRISLSNILFNPYPNGCEVRHLSKMIVLSVFSKSALPASFYLFSSNQSGFTIQLKVHKSCRWLDSNPRFLILEAIALTTEPKPLPKVTV